MKQFIVQYWLEFTFGIVVSILGIWCKHIKHRIKRRLAEDKKKDLEYDALKQGVLSLLHDRLFQTCSCYLELGYIPVDSAESIIDNVDMLYDAYHGLNGNGTGTDIHTRFHKLKIMSEENYNRQFGKE